MEKQDVTKHSRIKKQITSIAYGFKLKALAIIWYPRGLLKQAGCIGEVLAKSAPTA